MVQDEQFEVQRQLVILRIELHRDAFPLIHGPQPRVFGLSLEHDLVILCLNVLQYMCTCASGSSRGPSPK